ncbi:MAG: phospho-N-acetylmuramoyl-pentapeptide-transferase [Actinomycetota bacterium]|nr:phospho-N-acetylmuramoyl-pentapeptide-transferase [Actinomycetota bacterium]
MVALLVAGAVGFLATILGTPLLIGSLRVRGIGQQIREDGPSGHLVKAGTPTMGGIAIVGAAILGYTVAHAGRLEIFTARGIAAVVTIGLAALIGFVDDYMKVSRRRSLGLNARAKAGALLLVAAGFAVVAVKVLGVSTRLSFVRYDSPGWQLGAIGWSVLAVLAILGTTNAVNLTDGLDGLATGSSAFAFITFTIIGFFQLRHFFVYRNPYPASLDEAILSTAFIGACAGFLWWNAAPAKIFMGDTGSLGLGAAIAVIALLENVDLLLPIIGGLFVVETVSVILQVGSFKLFHRRVFKIAPIHHHFELLGWPETTVTVRFWILSGAFAALGIGAFYGAYLARGKVG